MFISWIYIFRQFKYFISLNRSLAPGSASLLKVLTDPRLPPEEHVDLSKPIRKLTVADWSLIARAFNEWPFAPDVCVCILTDPKASTHSFHQTLMITDAFVEENHRNRRS